MIEPPKPEAIPELYRKHGVKPVRQKYAAFNASGQLCEACLTTILQFEATMNRESFKPAHQNAEAANITGLPWMFVYGLVQGWDGNEICGSSIATDQIEASQGQAYGQAARKACEAAGLM